MTGMLQVGAYMTSRQDTVLNGVQQVKGSTLMHYREAPRKAEGTEVWPPKFCKVGFRDKWPILQLRMLLVRLTSCGPGSLQLFRRRNPGGLYGCPAVGKNSPLQISHRRASHL
jgi:hypothetical protein